MAFPLQPLQHPCEQRSSIKFVFKLLLSLVSSSAQHAQSQIVHHDTKYGLRISFENGHISSVRIVHPPSQPATDSPTTLVDNNVRSLSQSPKPRYDYRLMPDWHTSYLWYDADSPHALDGGYHVDEDVISFRYPALQAHYFAWQETYESAFEKQGCHLGSHARSFPNATECAAWEVEGCLIACWLALSDDVKSVEYRPGQKSYLVKGDGVEGVLERFLKDVLARFLTDVGMGLGE